MIPRHCREVGIKRVSFVLTKKNINEEALGKSAYINTNYLLLNNGSDWAVLKINKSSEQGLFRTIRSTEIISLPENTIYLENPELDVQNPSVMVGLGEEAGKDALIVKGRFEHISFVFKENTTPLFILDIVPPYPPKIVELAEAALGTGRIRKPIKIVPKVLDLNKLAETRRTNHIMFPCYASSLVSGLNGVDNALYLDQLPTLPVPAGEITLIGCDLSLKTFLSRYGEKPQFMEICPKKTIRDQERPCLTRCCIIDSGHIVEDDVAYLSWGASIGDVEEAIIDLLGLELGNIQEDIMLSSI